MQGGPTFPDLLKMGLPNLHRIEVISDIVSIATSSTENVRHPCFVSRKLVGIDLKLAPYLELPVLKGRVFLVRKDRRVKDLC